MEDKLNTLKTNFKNQYNKYYRTMNYVISYVEIDALYNVLALNVQSEYELTRQWERKVKEVLEIN